MSQVYTIIGLGLIGGSLAKDLKKKYPDSTIYGVDNSSVHRDQALDLGLIDEVYDSSELPILMPKSDMIILAVPVQYIEEILPNILDQIQPHQIVIDVGSTKESIVSAVKDHPNRGRYVATHPMAGTEYSGPKAAVSGLFENKCLVIVDKESTDPDALKNTEEMYREIGMNIVYHDAKDHDLHSAYVSHISHISSFALALTVLEKEKNEGRIFELAGGGFSSTVRLAKSSADTWVPIFENNRDHVLDVLDEHINIISKFRTHLIKKDFESFRKMIEEANNIEKIIK